MFELEDSDDVVTRRELNHRLREINERIEHMAASEDALNVALDQVATDLSAGIEAVQTELNALAAANPGIDVSGALAKAQALDATAKSLGALAPAATAPAAPSAPTATGTVEGTVSTSGGTAPIDTTGTAPAASAPADPASPTSGAPAPAAPPTTDPTTEPAAPAAEPTKAVYTFAGDSSQVDPGAWPSSGFETAEPTPQLLYYFSGDTQPGQSNGNGLSGGQWVLYTGAVQAVAPPAAA